MDWNTRTEGFKTSLAWLGASISAVTLNEWVAICTIIYTVINIAIAVKKFIYFGKVKTDDEQ